MSIYCYLEDIRIEYENLMSEKKELEYKLSAREDEIENLKYTIECREDEISDLKSTLSELKALL